MKVTALAGGVGGAKLAHGLAKAISPEDLTVIVNTGDDFEHFGLYICPDLDTVCYTLAGLANPATGWGRSDESWRAMDTVQELGGPGWFGLGDRDLGLHLERTRQLKAGTTLSQFTELVSRSWGIRSTVLPMSDDAVPTSVYTIDQEELSFQEYFVHRQCRPHVRGFRFNGVESASPAPGLLVALKQSDLVVICPSNPWVSIGPILAVPGIRATLQNRVVVAVTPIIGGKTVKGPAAKMYAEMGIEPTAVAVAQHYGDLLAGFVLDKVDQSSEGAVQDLGVRPYITDTLMSSDVDRQRLAEKILTFGESLEKSPQHNGTNKVLE
jgi:LPPG:FO 2-phospho-L-lactate transferase